MSMCHKPDISFFVGLTDVYSYVHYKRILAIAASNVRSGIRSFFIAQKGDKWII